MKISNQRPNKRIALIGLYTADAYNSLRWIKKIEFIKISQVIQNQNYILILYNRLNKHEALIAWRNDEPTKLKRKRTKLVCAFKANLETFYLNRVGIVVMLYKFVRFLESICIRRKQRKKANVMIEDESKRGEDIVRTTIMKI